MSAGRLCYLCVWLLLWRTTRASYYPVYGQGAQVLYNVTDNSTRFPDTQHIVEAAYEFFLSDLTFNVIDGTVISGAADKLYLLNTHDLREVSSLTWQPEATKNDSCMSSVTDSPDYNCRNHIRVAKPIPGVTNDNGQALMVCGTQATITPQCRVVNVSNDRELVASTTIVASQGIVSYYPDFSQFGEFREDSPNDMTYFTAGFFEGGSGLGRHFSMSFQSISVSASPTPNTLTTTERFRTINANNNWLRFPVTFVDYLKLDYTPLTTGSETDYQFYFAFLRESAGTGSDGVIQSRVARICRNDPGYTPTAPDLPYFTTYMKARIFCERQTETGDQFEAGREFLYNELRSIAFTEGGRYRGDGTYTKKLYGAFTGPIVGPHGTAICVYDAENTFDETTGVGGRSLNMFDIFREDLQIPDGGRDENDFVECAPTGRTATDAQNILINEEKFITQLESDPLFVMDGVFINQMVVDEQCVVTMADPDSCINQDVLFLGTDQGKILKVIFGTGSSGIFPVVAEEISLDDNNNIEKMVIQEEDGQRYLFVNTNSKIYKFPLARCSRHETCLDCVSARDPYCMWDRDTRGCVMNPFSASQNGMETVNSIRYMQNIHKGSGDTDGCTAEPHCEVMASASSYDKIQLEVSCVNTDEIKVIVADLDYEASLTLDDSGKGSHIISGSQGLQSYVIQLNISNSQLPSYVVITTTVTTPPGPPVAVTTDEIFIDLVTNVSFRVTVNIDKFTDYFGQYSFQLQGDSISSGDQLFTDGTSLTTSGLSPATIYNFNIVVSNSVGTATTTNQLFVKTLDGIPSEVRDLDAYPRERTVRLSWSRPGTTNGDIIGYSVKIVQGGSEVVEVRGCGIAIATEYNVTGLDPATVYVFTVAACTSGGEGEAVSTGQVTTLCSIPGQVENLQFTMATENQLRYTWEQPIITNTLPSHLNYMVQETCYNNSEINIVTKDSISLTTATIDNLLPLTLCCVRITPTSSCPSPSLSPISGPASEVCLTTNDVTPGIVTSLTATGVNRNAILVTWAPPSNYRRQGLKYVVTVNSMNHEVVDRNYLYVDGLVAGTEYTVSVVTVNSQGLSGASTSALSQTLPDIPPPPLNPELSVVNDNTLRLNWDAVDDAMNYTTVLRCNDNEPITDITVATEINFNIANPEPNFAWCTAQVQSENAIGRGEFSELVSIAIPSSAPGKPRCYLVDDRGSAVFISFDVTHPFSLDSLSFGYKVIPDYLSEADVKEETKMFNGSNVVAVPVARNTRYDFRLRLCNVEGCGGYCDELTNFTTSTTAPRPPAEVEVTRISHNSAHLSWTIPDNENSSSIMYHIQLSSSGAGQLTIQLAGIVTTHDLSGLEPQTNYTSAIRVTDLATDTEGVFGRTTIFATAIGVPTAPTATEANWIPDRKELSATWGPPNTSNGTITSYELRYSGNVLASCDNLTAVQRFSPTDRNYVTMETKEIELTRSYVVCVRAHTDKPGEWAPYIERDITVLGVTGEQGSCNADCNGLIVVAVVAGLAVVSTVISTIVLCLICRYQRTRNQIGEEDKRCSSCGNSQRSSPSDVGVTGGGGGGGGGGMTRYDRNSPSHGSNDTGFEDQPRPPYNSLQSTDSTYSTGSTTLKPLLNHSRP